MIPSPQKNQASHIVFRTEGGHRTGMGHLKRCLRLAMYLRDRLSPEITFILSPSDISLREFFKETPYKTLFLEAGTEKRALDDLCLHYPPQMWITDLRQVEDKSLFQELARRQGFLHIAIDDMHLCGVEAEITFNPSILPCNPSDHSNPHGAYYCGPEYFFSFPDEAPPLFPEKNGKRILVAMGGADVHGITPKLLRSFLKLREEAEIHAVLGPAFRGDVQKDFAEDQENIFFYHAPASLDPVIASMDVVITTGGLTLYETARLGVASIAVTQNSFESKVAQVFQDKGASLFLGEGDGAKPDHVTRAALSLLRNPGRLQAMSRLGQGLVKGGGAEKMAKILEKCPSSVHRGH